ncbi:flavodoxin/nitric oxide synthase [Rhodococcus sp. Z13]|uniref:Flavodoxin/nitric oxide synthase n=1 Tax=Rhodococcus sacchari TaxID=2962047 RepID=A0ACD4DGL0_9NOCA|nr:flavodoxin domain-containing protein [Rhodococcus sp. Z13]UYP19214.1 flavodoxin/nitric oxide synthase [Rhodococcus sp. Z13]
MTVLVATESSEGPVRTVAESVAAALEGRDIDVTLGDASDLERAEEFEGIVFGAEVEDGEYSPDTQEELQSRRTVLRQQVVWLFGVGSGEADECPELVGHLAASGYKSFSPTTEDDEVQSWVSLVADEIEGHS